MRIARSFVLLALLVTSACSSACSSSSSGTAGRAPSSAPGMVLRTYEVRLGLAIHTWTVPGRSDAPWLAYVHGGSWYTGRGDSPRARQWAPHEVARGYQVFGIEYRLTPHARWPAQRADVAASIDWVRQHAGRFGIAARRGVIVGESAGGQLAAIEAARTATGRFAGAVDLAGVVDPLAVLRAPYRDLRVASRSYVGCSPDACPDVWQQTRAITHLDRAAPPFLVVHAVRDPIVPLSMSRAFAAQLHAIGARVTLRIVPGRFHPLLLLPSVLPALDAFLDRCVG